VINLSSYLIAASAISKLNYLCTLSQENIAIRNPAVVEASNTISNENNYRQQENC